MSDTIYTVSRRELDIKNHLGYSHCYDLLRNSEKIISFVSYEHAMQVKHRITDAIEYENQNHNH